MEEWIQDNWADKILLVVSHDRAFLNRVCTDTVDMKHTILQAFPGPYDDYADNQEERQAHKAHMMDALARKRKHVQQTIHNCTVMGHKNHDDGKLAQAASRKKKLKERLVGSDKLENGKRLKFSYHVGLSTTKRIALQADVPDKPVSFNFRMADPLKSNSPPMSIRDVSFSYDNKRSVIRNVSFDLETSGIVVIMGLNGSGIVVIVCIYIRQIHIDEVAGWHY